MSNGNYRFGDPPAYRLEAVVLRIGGVVVGRQHSNWRRRSDIQLCDSCFDDWTAYKAWQPLEPHQMLPPRCGHLEVHNAE